MAVQAGVQFFVSCQSFRGESSKGGQRWNPRFSPYILFLQLEPARGVGFHGTGVKSVDQHLPAVDKPPHHLMASFLDFHAVGTYIMGIVVAVEHQGIKPFDVELQALQCRGQLGVGAQMGEALWDIGGNHVDAPGERGDVLRAYA